MLLTISQNADVCFSHITLKELLSSPLYQFTWRCLPCLYRRCEMHHLPTNAETRLQEGLGKTTRRRCKKSDTALDMIAGHTDLSCSRKPWRNCNGCKLWSKYLQQYNPFMVAPVLHQFQCSCPRWSMNLTSVNTASITTSDHWLILAMTASTCWKCARATQKSWNTGLELARGVWLDLCRHYLSEHK